MLPLLMRRLVQWVAAVISGQVGRRERLWRGRFGLGSKVCTTETLTTPAQRLYAD